MDNVYGITDDLLDDITFNLKEQEQVVPNDVKYENVVKVSNYQVRGFKSRSNAIAKQIGNAMLFRAASFATSYQSASDYVRAVLEDCYGVKVDVDEGPLHAVKTISSLDIVHMYMKKSRLPVSVKKKFMYTLAEELAKSSAIAINKSSSMSLSNNIRAMIASSVAQNAKPNQSVINDSPKPKVKAAKRTRR